MKQLGKFIKPPRPDASIGTPLLGKEGKLLINFSSYLRRSTLTKASGGGGWIFFKLFTVILVFFTIWTDINSQEKTKAITFSGYITTMQSSMLD